MVVDVEEKLVKKRKHDDESHADVKRKRFVFHRMLTYRSTRIHLHFRSVSDVTAPVTTSSLPDKTSMIKNSEETVKKTKKLSETTGESYTQINVTPASVVEFEQELKQTLEKIIKVSLTTLKKKVFILTLFLC